MSLTSAYKAFLASPSAASLTSNAAINYIPTVVTVNTADGIEKHFVREQKVLKRRSENVLHSIESDNALCIELDTTIEFIAGGGTYLPGLDDNFLSGQTANLPMVHIVQFSDDLKIQQVRIYWDQGSLLKSVEVIGARGRNWPVKDGVDSLRTIRKSFAAAPASSTTPMKQLVNRPKSGSNAMSDPMASLDLFKPRNVEEEDEGTGLPRAPRGAARPPTREYSELFAAAQADPRERSESPSKSRSRAKTGAGKSYQEPRVFDVEKQQAPDASPQKKVVGQKYSHFEFSDQPVVDTAKPRTRDRRHDSQWDFADFATPAKPATRIRPQEQRHFTWDQEEDVETPQARNRHTNQARRDAETHFDFKDDGVMPDHKARGHTRAQGSMNTDSKLYKNNLYDENGIPGTPRNETGITNVKDRSKDFSAHWQMEEGTPKTAQDPNDRRGALQRPTTTTTDNKSRVKDFDRQFNIQDEEPELSEKSASDLNRAGGAGTQGRGNRSTGGPGLRRGAPQSSWSFEDAEEPQSAKKIYRTAGNGMGSRTGKRGWGIGDESAEE